MSVTKTVKSSGGDYSSLSAWEAGMQADLTGTGYSEAVCYALDDASAVSILGWTTTVDDYINIRVDASARHAGVWDGDKYNLVLNNVDALILNEDYIRIDGLQVSVSGMNGNGDDPVSIPNGGVGASNDIWLSNLIVKGSNDGTYYQFGIGIVDSDTKLKCWNCLIYNIGGVASSAGFRNTGTNYFYSSTVLGGQYTVYVAGGTLHAKNVYAGGSSAEDFYRSSGTLNKTNCASEDASADDTNTTVETASDCIINIAIDTDTFVNVTGGSEDYHLAADGNSPLQGAGVDTSGESAPLDFTTDIDGDTIVNWSIGADDGTSAVAYTLACDGGSYALTGTAASPLKASKCAADAGTYALTGTAAGAYYGRKVAAESGPYALTGGAATLLRAARIAAEAAGYTLTGSAAGTLYGRLLAAESGVYQLTGSDVAALFGRKLAAEGGVYTLTGADVTLTKTSLGAYVITAEGGVYAVTGQAATLLRAAKVGAEGGAYAMTGQAASTLYGRLISAAAGSYALTGADTATLFGRKLSAESGTYALTGQDVTFVYTPVGAYVLTCEGAVYQLTGADAALKRAAKLSAEGGSYVLEGQAASTLVARLLDAGAGAYAVTGIDATITYSAAGQYKITCDAGSFIVSGADLAFWVGVLHAAPIVAKSPARTVTAPESRSKVRAKSPTRTVTVDRRRTWN